MKKKLLTEDQIKKTYGPATMTDQNQNKTLDRLMIYENQFKKFHKHADDGVLIHQHFELCAKKT